MNAVVAAPLRQINLYNEALLPKREVFSARLIALWVIATALIMTAIASWTVTETRRLSRDATTQAASQAAQQSAVGANAGEPLITPQQLDAQEQTVRTQQALLATRRAARDLLKRGLADDQHGPSAVMRLMSGTMPPQAWLTDLRIAGGQIEVIGKTLDPAVVNVWLERLHAAGMLAAKPPATVRLERVDGSTPTRALPVYTFVMTALLATPFADDGSRP